MIVLDCKQGSYEWKVARLGLPTASQFGRILTPKTRKPAAGASTYRNELLAESFLGVPNSPPPTGFMGRGNVLEAEARRYYEFQRDVKVQGVGLILRDDRMVGGSPDGLVGEDGGVEIKCLSASNHIGMLLGDDMDRYVAQVQGYMMLTNRCWWDLVAYNPVLPTTIAHIKRDDDYISALTVALAAFTHSLENGRDALLALGCVAQEPATEAEERAARVEAESFLPI